MAGSWCTNTIRKNSDYGYGFWYCFLEDLKRGSAAVDKAYKAKCLPKKTV